MRIKYICIFILFSLAITSCMQERREILPDLEHIRIIYCTPTEFGKCLPLEIENTIDGWQARYIGTPSKGSLKIEPHYEINNDGDSIVVFLEYLEDGRTNGKYILHKSTWLVNAYDGISHISSPKNDTIVFYTNIIEDGTIFTANPDAKEAIRKTMEYEGNDTIGCGSERRDLNMAYLIHSNPGTIHERIKVEDLLIHDSPDGKLRIYTFNGYTGGNGAGSNYDIGILQYETGNGEIAVLDFFTSLLYNSLTDFGEANFPYCTINSVRNVATGGGNFYLIEALFNDSRPMSLNGSDEFFKTDDTVLFAFTIKNDKLTPARILEKDWKIEIIGSQETKELHFGYDKRTNMVRVPIVEGDGHLFNGKYRELKIGNNNL